jgi:hypothetical protein
MGTDGEAGHVAVQRLLRLGDPARDLLEEGPHLLGEVAPVGLQPEPLRALAERHES